MRRMRWIIGLGACAAAIGPPVAIAAPNLIVNGSFEEPNVATGSFAILPSVPGWSHQARPGTTSAGIEIQDVPGLVAPGGGAQFAELDSDGPSRIFQDVATSPGSTYRLTFQWTPRPGTLAAENHFTVSAGPASATFGPLAGLAGASWRGAAIDFVATATSSQIAFLDLSPEQGANQGLGAFIDLVSVELINSPPVCSAVAPDPATLWPPNHKLRTVTLGGATDPDGDPVALTVTGVSSDEPANGRGDGNTAQDSLLGPGPAQARLRAERSGRGDGRVYTLVYTAEDPSGASCSGTEAVRVPHDRR